MIANKELKQQAKESMEGNWGNIIGIILLYLGISFITGLILGMIGIENKIVTNTASLIISALFQFGYLSFFLKISRNEEVEVEELWSKIKMFLPYILASVTVGFFTTLWTLLLIIPGIIASIRYSMIYFIMLDNPEMSAMEALDESKRIMEGHKMQYFKLMVSFLGWIVLGILTLGILYVWLIPYMTVTQCNFYNQIKKTNNV